ncbi:MAG: hypothetical protein NT154_20025 [Verrucomicrobia bacterium]|nr:hypothetical protein [Verrucomicrobiota bacterium]
MSLSEKLGTQAGKMYIDKQGQAAVVMPPDRKADEPHVTMRWDADPTKGQLNSIHAHGNNGVDTQVP